MIIGVVLAQNIQRELRSGIHVPPCSCAAPPPVLMMFFPSGVQRLSCPQHVLVLGSSAARRCDDRVYEHWGVSGVKCVFRGVVARW